MQLRKTLLALVPFVGLAGAVHADGLSYTYGEVAYAGVDGEIGGVDFDGGGFGVAGSVAVGENLFLTGRYDSTEVDFENGPRDVDFDTVALGIGGHVPLAENVDLVGTVSWVNLDAGSAGDQDGINLGLGVRALATEQFEWGAGIDYTDVDDDGEFGFSVSGRYHFTPNFSAGLQLATDENADVLTTTASLRMQL